MSLLGTGLWAMGQAMALSLVLDIPWTAPPADRMGSNPLSRNYTTKDGRTLAFTCLQAGKYWPPLCEVIGRPELVTDPRFADHASLLENNLAAVEVLDEVFAGRDARRVAGAARALHRPVGGGAGHARGGRDPQTVANGYLQECQTATGTPFRLVAAPVQYDEQPAVPGRAPEFNEHGDEILDRARTRHGRHHRPQGQGRCRLSERVSQSSVVSRVTTASVPEPPDYDESSARRDHQASAAVIALSASWMPSPTSPAVAAQCKGTRARAPGSQRCSSRVSGSGAVPS